MSATGTNTIRLALLLHGPLRKWQADALLALSDQGLVVPIAVVHAGDGGVTGIPWLEKVQVMKEVGLPLAWADVAMIDGAHDPTGAATQLGRHRPDLLLVFGASHVDPQLAGVAPHGAWSYHFGPADAEGPVPVLLEAIAGGALAHARLLRASGEGGRAVLREAVVGVEDDALALMQAMLELVSRWPTDILRGLVSTGPVPDAGPWSGSEEVRYRPPGKVALLGFRFQRWLQRHRLWRKPAVELGEWNIGVLQQPISVLLDSEGSRGVRWLPAPSASGSRATPFGYFHDEQLNVLFEKSDVHEGEGVIARLRPRSDNVLKRSRTMLDIGRPISYPYTVEQDGAVYVVLDHPTDGNVVLYRVNANNDGLDRVTTLVEEPLSGASLFRHQGRWWLVGTKAPHVDAALYVYWSEELGGPFRPHRHNPVKVDVRSSRPGGTPFVHEGRLWRPAQDRTPGAAVRIVFNEVTELTPERFTELPGDHLGLFTHTAYAKGMRTVCAVGGVTVVDGLRDRSLVPKPDKRKERTDRSGRNSNQES